MASAIEDEAADSACVTRKVVYQRALERSRFSDDSSHNDENAQRFGYPGALVSAYVLAGLGSEPMVRYFGGSWFTTGAIALTFIGTGVQQGDEVECRGVMTGSEACEGGRRVAFDLTMVKGGVIAVAGHASGVAACDAASSAGS